MSEQEEREFWNAVDPYDHELAKELTKTFQRLTELSDEDMEEDNRSITIRKALVVFVRVLEAVRSIVDERRVAEPTHRTVVAIGEIARMYTAVTDTGAVRRRLVMIVQQAAQSVAREFREPREPGDHNEPLVDAAAMQILMRSTLEISIVFEGLRHHLDEIMDRLHSLKGQDASDNDAQLIAGMLSTRVNWLGDCDDKGAYQKFRSACNKGQKLG